VSASILFPLRIVARTVWMVQDATGRFICEAIGPDEAKAVSDALAAIQPPDEAPAETRESADVEQTTPEPSALDRFRRKQDHLLCTLLAIEQQNARAEPTSARHIARAVIGPHGDGRSTAHDCIALAERGLVDHMTRSDLGPLPVNEYWITDKGRALLSDAVPSLGLHATSPKALYAYRLVRDLLVAQDGPAEEFVYFIDCPQTGLFKIGRTMEPVRRMKGLQTMSGAPLKMIGLFRAEGRCEQELRWIFASFRRHGEWFERCGRREDVDTGEAIEDAAEILDTFVPLFSMHRETADEVQRSVFDASFPAEMGPIEEGLR